MIEYAKETAREAGLFLKESLGNILNIEHKQGDERNLVTQIDKQSEDMIINRLRKEFPSHEILAEESGRSSRTSDYRWVIDPLDGTVNYTHGIKIFCVSIGLEYKGEIILGAVYDPSLDELFYAERGKGAYLNGTPLHVSRADRLIRSLLVTGFPYDLNKNEKTVGNHFMHFLYEAQGIRRLGSAALDLCYVAAGRFDGYWEVLLQPWDMAAGRLFVEEAGGRVTDMSGRKSTIYQRDLLATNGLIHDAMLDIIKRGMQD